MPAGSIHFEAGPWHGTAETESSKRAASLWIYAARSPVGLSIRGIDLLTCSNFSQGDQPGSPLQLHFLEVRVQLRPIKVVVHIPGRGVEREASIHVRIHSATTNGHIAVSATALISLLNPKISVTFRARQCDSYETAWWESYPKPPIK
eukprot:4212712-Pleurochrysis_carterae.AAC.2